jgi:hypothetical protein
LELPVTISGNQKEKKSRRKSPKKYFESQRFLTVGWVREASNFLILA